MVNKPIVEYFVAPDESMSAHDVAELRERLGITEIQGEPIYIMADALGFHHFTHETPKGKGNTELVWINGYLEIVRVHTCFRVSREHFRTLEASRWQSWKWFYPRLRYSLFKHNTETGRIVPITLQMACERRGR